VTIQPLNTQSKNVGFPCPKIKGSFALNFNITWITPKSLAQAGHQPLTTHQVWKASPLFRVLQQLYDRGPSCTVRFVVYFCEGQSEGDTLTRNPLTRGTSGSLHLGAAANTDFCTMDQTLHFVAAAAQQQSERAGWMPTQMARPSRAATKVCGDRVEPCSRSLPPRFSPPSATPGQQSQHTHSKHSLLHRATTQVVFHLGRLPLPPKFLLSFWCPGFGKGSASKYTAFREETVTSGGGASSWHL